MTPTDTAASESGMAIFNARVVTPEQVLESAEVVVQEGRIVAVGPHTKAGRRMRRIDAHGRLLLPGFIDIHSDVIENAIQPRPGGRFPVDVALQELDKQLVACGVTTIYHCLCFLSSDENPPFRNAEMTDNLIHQIRSLAGGFSARTRLHARYEITNQEAFDHVTELIRNGWIDFFSIMDHTPGQGQFAELSHFRDYYSSARGLSREQVDTIIERRLESSRNINWQRLEGLGRLCRSQGVRMASHDDDSAAKVAAVNRLGATLSEFPVNLEAAQAARRYGMLISLGSPNVLRGASLTGNLSGREALRAGLGDILCSDYAPMSLLHAALQLNREQILSLPRAIELITLNPARATGTDGQVGSIEVGKAADLVLVEDRRPVATVSRTFVAGQEVFCSGL
jgi:alpha-D-ribose 1-methylphosphonate 5-triphosphate diphosphatase